MQLPTLQQDGVHVVHNCPSPALAAHLWSRYRFVRDLGVYIDSNLSMQGYIQRTVSCCFAVLRKLWTIRWQIPTAVFQSLIVALVLPRLDYCNSVLYGLPAYLIRRLQSVQNAAARLIFRIRRSEHNQSPAHQPSLAARP